jgi:hypothetical protein
MNGELEGLDNPDWKVLGNAELRDGGFFFSNAVMLPEGSEFDEIFRELDDGPRSFINRVEIKDPYLKPLRVRPDDTVPPGSGAILSLSHFFIGQDYGIGISLAYTNNPEKWRLFLGYPQEEYTELVSVGPHIALEMRLDDAQSQVSFFYDNNINDAVSPLSYGPYRYRGGYSEQQFTSFIAVASGLGEGHGTLDHWSFTIPGASIVGDFNGDGLLNVFDIDQLSIAVRSGQHDLKFDLTSDNRVTEVDRQVWVETLRKTYFGDANLDGQFSTHDLVAVFQAAEYEDSLIENSTWSTGDWNGDGDFSSRDLVTAFQGNGFEHGPRAAVFVPEPCSLMLAVMSVTLLARTKCCSTKCVCRESTPRA